MVGTKQHDYLNCLTPSSNPGPVSRGGIPKQVRRFQNSEVGPKNTVSKLPKQKQVQEVLILDRRVISPTVPNSCRIWGALQNKHKNHYETIWVFMNIPFGPKMTMGNFSHVLKVKSRVVFLMFTP